LSNQETATCQPTLVGITVLMARDLYQTVPAEDQVDFFCDTITMPFN